MRRFICALISGVALTLLAAPTSDTAEAGWRGRGYYGGGYRGFYGGGGYRGYYGGYRGYYGGYRGYYGGYRGLIALTIGHIITDITARITGPLITAITALTIGRITGTTNRLTATTRPPTTRDIRTTAITRRPSITVPDQRFTLIIASSAGSAGFSRQRSMNASLCL